MSKLTVWFAIVLSFLSGLLVSTYTQPAKAQDAPPAQTKSAQDDESKSGNTDKENSAAKSDNAGDNKDEGETKDSPMTAEEKAAAAAATHKIKLLLASLTVFVLAIFVGFEIITKVPPTLHTPLMSGSNAISGITLVGAVIIAGVGMQQAGAAIVGTIAVALATINVVGGFLVTHRMLAMFNKRR